MAFPENRKHQEVTWPVPCCQVCSLMFTFVWLDRALRVSYLQRGVFSFIHNDPMFERIYYFSEPFRLEIISNSFSYMSNFQVDFSAWIGVNEWIKTHMAASSYHLWILSPKYGHTGNEEMLTENHGLPFAVRWPNLDLKVFNSPPCHFKEWEATLDIHNTQPPLKQHCWFNINTVHVTWLYNIKGDQLLLNFGMKF